GQPRRPTAGPVGQGVLPDQGPDDGVMDIERWTPGGAVDQSRTQRAGPHRRRLRLPGQSSFRMPPTPRLLANSELLLLPNRLRYHASSASFLLSPWAVRLTFFTVLAGLRPACRSGRRSRSRRSPPCRLWSGTGTADYEPRG